MNNFQAEQKLITEKLQTVNRPSTFNEEQWTAVCNLNNKMRQIEGDYMREGRTEFPRFTFEVLKAFLVTPRHIFCHPQFAHQAYEDRARPISCDQVISQPHLVAMMTALLQVKAGDKVNFIK